MGRIPFVVQNDGRIICHFFRRHSKDRLCGMVAMRSHILEAVGMRFARGQEDHEGSKHVDVLGAAGPSGWLGSHVQEGRTTSEIASWQ